MSEQIGILQAEGASGKKEGSIFNPAFSLSLSTDF
jgi:hypothetical protein